MKIKLSSEQYEKAKQVMSDDFMFNYCRLDKQYGTHLKESMKNYNPETQVLSMKSYDVRNLSQGLDIYFHKISNKQDSKCNEVVDLLDDALGKEMAKQRTQTAGKESSLGM